ncbi:MAG: hypothetical protein KDC88_13770 [Ignavibacteriae bacterium]|nr:hypothetical protein [Ignavibacteriota bacterium]
MYNPVDGMLTVANHTFNSQHDLMIQAKAIDFTGKDSLIFQWFIEVTPTSVQKIESIKRTLDKLCSEKGGFLSLRLLSSNQNIIDDNLYWFPDSSGNYSGLQQMAKSNLEVKVRKEQTGKIEVKLVNPKDETVAFFNRISLVDRKTKKRILPTFYSDNYISVLPGEEKIIFIDHKAEQNDKELAISISGWNVDEQYFAIE